jgi:hypothetical protein
MLKKLTNNKSNGMKREFIERRAMDPCTLPCKFECVDLQIPDFSMYAMLTF